MLHLPLTALVSAYSGVTQTRNDLVTDVIGPSCYTRIYRFSPDRDAAKPNIQTLTYINVPIKCSQSELPSGNQHLPGRIVAYFEKAIGPRGWTTDQIKGLHRPELGSDQRARPTMYIPHLHESAQLSPV